MTEFSPQSPMTVNPHYCTSSAANSVFSNTGLSPQQNFLFLNNQVGMYPIAGPHMLLKDPLLLSKHLEKLKIDIKKIVPEEFNGNIILDYNAWSPQWRLICDNFQNEWIETWQKVNPQKVNPQKINQWKACGKEYFYQKMANFYEETTQEFFSATIKTIRAIRSSIKIGILDYAWYKAVNDKEIIDIKENTQKHLQSSTNNDTGKNLDKNYTASDNFSAF